MPRVWTERMTRAARYVEAYVRAGWRLTDALHDYALGGGVIRADEWSILWRATRDVEYRWQLLTRLDPNFVPPETFFLERDFRYQQRYVYSFEFTPVFREVIEGEERIVYGPRQFRQIESDVPLSIAEARRALLESLRRWGEEGISPPVEEVVIHATRLYKRIPD